MFHAKQVGNSFHFTTLILTGLFLSASAISHSQPRYAYTTEKVVEGVYVLKPEINQYRWVTSNIIVVISDDDVLVVDSGLIPAAADEAILEIRKITDKPVRYLVNTHWHGDHWQGNESFLKEFPKIEIIATEQGRKGMSRNGMVWAQQLYPRYFENYINSYEKALTTKILDGATLDAAQLTELKAGLAAMRADLEDIRKLKPVLPSLTYADQLAINRGGHNIQLLYLGIGNTSGDAVIYLPQEKVVITGDLVVYPSPYESGMFSPEWLETSRKLDALDFQYLIPGHGEVQKDHGYLQFLNALFAEIISQVGKAYESGVARGDDIKQAVTHQSVTAQLNKIPAYAGYTQNLNAEFVTSAVRTAYMRIIQGKQ